MAIEEEVDIGHAVRVLPNIDSLDLKKVFGRNQNLIFAMKNRTIKPMYHETKATK
jgi:hypothetical protein